MKPRVVFDTNILFSAVGWHGNPGRCVEYARAGDIRGVTCVEILEELSAKLAEKLEFDDEQIEAVIGSLLGIFDVVAITGAMTGMQSDPKDDKIIECAVVGAATHIVTGDRKHLLPLQKYGEIEIVTAVKLLEIVGQARR